MVQVQLVFDTCTKIQVKAHNCLSSEEQTPRLDANISLTESDLNQIWNSTTTANFWSSFRSKSSKLPQLLLTTQRCSIQTDIGGLNWSLNGSILNQVHHIDTVCSSVVALSKKMQNTRVLLMSVLLVYFHLNKTLILNYAKT